MNPPLISVITPTFNSGAKIAATIASVLSQGKGLYEFIVIDGGSTDGTLAHLRAQGPALRYLSEPDEGIYDAMNKGIRLTSGKFLHRNFFLEPGTDVPIIYFRVQGGLSDSLFWNHKRPGLLAPVLPW